MFVFQNLAGHMFVYLKWHIEGEYLVNKYQKESHVRFPELAVWVPSTWFTSIRSSRMSIFQNWLVDIEFLVLKYLARSCNVHFSEQASRNRVLGLQVFA
jgi:hypothetical protein